MSTTLKRLSKLILTLGMIFMLSLPSLAHAAETDGSNQVELTVTENKDSKSGAEIADLTIKNTSGKTVTNISFTADLPEILHDGELKSVTFPVGTLVAGASKTYQVIRKADGTVATNALPTTGNQSSTPLPTTGEKVAPTVLVFGLILLALVAVMAVKHHQAKKILAFALLVAGIGGAAISSADTYHHKSDVKDYPVTLAGKTYVFRLMVEGDFESDATTPTPLPTPETYTLTFDSQGGSSLESVTDLTEGARLTEPQTPTKTGYDFEGWYTTAEFSGTAWDFETDKMPAQDLTLYAKWTEKSYAITYELDEGVNSENNPETYTYGTGILSFEPATKTGYTFVGWFDKAVDGEKITEISSTETDAQTLYAYWEEVPSVIVPSNATPGTEFAFAGSQWRILDMDMNDNSDDGLQALVIKVESIGDSKFNGSGNTYFDANGTNGYERSRLDGGVGQKIDEWYENTIANTPSLAAVVQKVKLNNPDFTTFFAIGFSPENWSWSSFHQDNRFATTLDATGSQQAFALSYGDIHNHMRISTSETDSALLNFSSSGTNRYWLRSASYYVDCAGIVYDTGNFNSSASVDFFSYPVHPALSIMIKKDE